MTLAKAVRQRVHSIASRGCVHQSALPPSQSVLVSTGSGYKVPSRPHVTSICHKMFDSLKEELLAKLDSPYVSLTTDIWTSRTQQPYLTVTAHFITEKWKMESKVLQTRERPERHTGMNISERLKAAAGEWNIANDRLAAVVRDNAANMVLAVDLVGEWDDLGCFGHTLQLCCQCRFEPEPTKSFAGCSS